MLFRDPLDGDLIAVVHGCLIAADQEKSNKTSDRENHDAAQPVEPHGLGRLTHKDPPDVKQEERQDKQDADDDMEQ